MQFPSQKEVPKPVESGAAAIECPDLLMAVQVADQGNRRSGAVRRHGFGIEHGLDKAFRLVDSLWAMTMFPAIIGTA